MTKTILEMKAVLAHNKTLAKPEREMLEECLRSLEKIEYIWTVYNLYFDKEIAHGQAISTIIKRLSGPADAEIDENV